MSALRTARRERLAPLPVDSRAKSSALFIGACPPASPRRLTLPSLALFLSGSLKSHCKAKVGYYVPVVPNQVTQLGLSFRTWGGRRRNAGPKIKGAQPRVSHKTSGPILKRRFPVHVTMRMREGVCHLRSASCLRALKNVFHAANSRVGFRLVHFSVQGNHVHFLVEAEGTRELSRGMQGLNVRLALALNRLMRRRGKVFADRYHAVILRTPKQAANALHYVLHNRQHHAPGRYSEDWRDPFASARSAAYGAAHPVALGDSVGGARRARARPSARGW